jgi:hypothetical protein
VQSEALNQGGEVFRKDLEGMRMRVVHGNTLTAAVILHRLPADCGEVFLTGGTSKLGRALALYLIRKGVRVLVRSKGKGIVSEEPSKAHLGRLVDVNERRGTPPSQGLPTHYWRRVFCRSGVVSSHSTHARNGPSARHSRVHCWHRRRG